MNIKPCITDYMDSQGGLLNAADIQRLGFSRSLLYTYTRAGLLERYRCGLYARPDSLVDDMAYIQRKFPTLIFSHDSALYIHGLSERTPFRHTVTIPSDATLPRSLSNDCTCFYIAPRLHALGMTEGKTPFGNTVRCYNAERSVCDVLRSRNRIDTETYSAALKLYFSRREKDLHRLAEYAEQFGVMQKLTPYLEVLV